METTKNIITKTRQELLDEFAKKWGYQSGEGYGVAIFDCREELLKDLDELMVSMLPSDDDIKKIFSQSPENKIHPDRFKLHGALWLKKFFLNK